MSAACPACGARIGPRARFCPACGASQEIALDEHLAARRRERARFRAAVTALQWVFVLPVLGTIGLFFWQRDGGLSEELLFGVHAALLAVAGACGVWGLRPGGLRASLPLRASPRWYAIALAVAAGMLAMGIAWVFALERLTGVPASGAELPAVYVVSALLVAPLLEEWLCRGVLWEAARRIAGAMPTIVITAALFAFLHGLNGGWVLELPHRFAGGLLLGWLRLRSGSLLPCVLAHFLNNAAAVLLGG